MTTMQLQKRPAVQGIPPREDALAVAREADQCVRWLRVQGFEVLTVEKGNRNPRIHIRTSPLCEQLEGAVYRYERVCQQESRHWRVCQHEVRYWVAIRFGCEVRWTEERAVH